MSRILVIFVDGVGIGKPDPESNPFFQREFKFINRIFNDTPSLDNQKLQNRDNYFFPVDACMDVEGIPQSGTGQTSILCGINASELLGQHFGPFPHSKLYPIIEDKNIFRLLKNDGKHVHFANGYPQRFFDYLASGHKRVGSFATAVMKSGMKLNSYDDVLAGNALTAEITNKVWKERLGYDIPVISPETAGDRLITITSKNDFTLYEFFLTDHLGHGRNKDNFEEIVNAFDTFLYHIITNIPEDLTLLICSDHGNFEDLSIKQHTLNPAIAITAGKDSDALAIRIKKLYDIQPAIMDMLCE